MWNESDDAVMRHLKCQWRAVARAAAGAVDTAVARRALNAVGPSSYAALLVRLAA
jgi:hypothetical protein